MTGRILHWSATPGGVCTGRDMQTLNVVDNHHSVNCPICLHQMGRRNRNHSWAVFLEGKFQMSYVRETEARRMAAAIGGSLCKWDTEVQMWKYCD